MKKLLLMVSAIAAGFTSVAQADISISGSAGLGYVSGNTNVDDVYTGGAISFALSSTLDNGVTVSTSAGIRMDTNDAKKTVTTQADTDVSSSSNTTGVFVKGVYGLATGFTAITFAGGNNSVTWGQDVGLAGEGAGSVGGVASDLVDEGGYARDNSAALSDDSGGGLTWSTTMGDASVSLSYLAQVGGTENSNEIRLGDSADTTASGVSVSLPMGSLAVSAGYATIENTDSIVGASAAYSVAGGTVTVGYTSVTVTGADDESAWSGNYKTSLGSAAVAVGYSSAKKGTLTGTLLEAQISQSLGGGASIYAEIQSSSDTTGSATTDGTNMAVGTKYAF
jgi:hypothetical protein